MKEFATAAPSMEEYFKVYEEAAEKSGDIVVILVSAALSATHEAAVQARDLFLKDHSGVNIQVLDSRNASGAEGFMTLEMAKAARAGNSLADVVKVAEDMMPKVRWYCAMETLKYLIKIGRAPKTAYMGELFQVKPIIGMVSNTGLVENMGRARGMNKAMEKMVEMMGQYLDPAKPAHINIHYTNSIDNGQYLKRLVVERFETEELYVTPYSPVMCGTTGPCIAVSFYG
jgi:DegV family protein with EDD domain